MRTLQAKFLTLVLSLLGVLGPATAGARERPAHRKAMAVSALGLPQAVLGVDPLTLPAAVDPEGVQAAVARGESAANGSGIAVRGSASSAGSAVNSEPDVDLDSSDDVKPDKLCGEDPQCGTIHKIDLLPEVVFDTMAELPVVGLLVIPMTKGMTIDPGEGLPALTFAVKPTKITRGSGLVAIGHF